MLATGSGCHRKGQGMLKGAIIVGVFGGTALLGQAAADVNTDGVGKWFGPIMTSFANVVGTLFAYLTVRDSKKYDAERIQLKHEIKQAKEDHSACLQERAELRKELDEFKAEQRKQFEELWNEMHGGEGGERRKEQKPNTPRRRRTDKGSRELPVLPPPPPPADGGENQGQIEGFDV